MEHSVRTPYSFNIAYSVVSAESRTKHKKKEVDMGDIDRLKLPNQDYIHSTQPFCMHSVQYGQDQRRALTLVVLELGMISCRTEN